MVPATMSYTVLLCWKKSSVMKTGKRNAIERFLFKARTVDLLEKTSHEQILVLACFLQICRISECTTHAEKVTLDAGTTRMRLGRTSTVESQVTTRNPSRNFPGVAPPAPQIQIICRNKQKQGAKKEYWFKELYIRQTALQCNQKLPLANIIITCVQPVIEKSPFCDISLIAPNQEQILLLCFLVRGVQANLFANAVTNDGNQLSRKKTEGSVM